MAFSFNDQDDVIRQLQQNLAWLQKSADALQQRGQQAAIYEISSDLMEEALRALEKRAFAPPGAGGAPPGMPPGMPMDPAMMGMPPGMPPGGAPPGMPPGMPMDPAMMGMPPGGAPPGLPPGLPPDLLAGLGVSPAGPDTGGPPPPEGGGPGEEPAQTGNRLMDMSVDEFKGAMTEAVEKGVASGFADLSRSLDDVVDKLSALVSALSANLPGNPRPLR